MATLAAFAAIPATGHPAHTVGVPLLFGLVVNAASLNAITTNFRTIYNEAYALAPTFWEKVAMRTPSTTKTEDYKWLGEFPQMREWFGDKQIKNLEAFDYVIKNKDYESTIKLDRNDIEDDTYGLYTPRIQGAGRAAKVFPDFQIFKLLQAGFTTNCFDGQPFFAAVHAFGKVQFSNKGTKKLNCAGLAAAQASYGAARVAMLSMTDDQGTPLGLTKFVLAVSPTNADTATTLMASERLQDGFPNPYKGTAEAAVVPYLQGDAWFLLAVELPIKPLIYQSRKEPVFLAHVDPASDAVFNRKEFLYGVEARGNFGFGLPQLGYGSDGTVA
ncbi:MAG: Mu-like prophage major head subunit gpT family protein [Proteobacteria bacterium]|nr:Mu-like prophage major head subunit gpT family protein [Pseudomonadota bacterium]